MYKLAVLASAVSALSLSQGQCAPNEGTFKKQLFKEGTMDMVRELIICVDKQNNPEVYEEILWGASTCYWFNENELMWGVRPVERLVF